MTGPSRPAGMPYPMRSTSSTASFAFATRSSQFPAIGGSLFSPSQTSSPFGASYSSRPSTKSSRARALEDRRRASRWQHRHQISAPEAWAAETVLPRTPTFGRPHALRPATGTPRAQRPWDGRWDGPSYVDPWNHAFTVVRSARPALRTPTGTVPRLTAGVVLAGVGARHVAHLPGRAAAAPRQAVAPEVSRVLQSEGAPRRRERRDAPSFMVPLFSEGAYSEHCESWLLRVASRLLRMRVECCVSGCVPYCMTADWCDESGGETRGLEPPRGRPASGRSAKRSWLRRRGKAAKAGGSPGGRAKLLKSRRLLMSRTPL